MLSNRQFKGRGLKINEYPTNTVSQNKALIQSSKKVREIL
jgi:hypothetical protein